MQASSTDPVPAAALGVPPALPRVWPFPTYLGRPFVAPGPVVVPSRPLVELEQEALL